MAATANKKRHHWYFYAGITAAIIVGVLLLLSGAFVGWLTATEYKPAPVEQAARGQIEDGFLRAEENYKGQPLKILTWNTGYCGLGEESDFVLDGGKTSNPESKEVVEKNLNGISDFLGEVDADITMLQEVDVDSARSYHQNQWQIYGNTDLDRQDAAFAPNYVCNFVPFPPADPISSVNSGVATYSRFRMEECTRESLPVPFSWPMRTANLKRCLLVSRIPIEGTGHELVMVNLHLEAYDDGDGKTAQTQQLLTLLAEEYEKGNYVIAGGDFNQVFPGAKHEVKETSAWVPGLLPEIPAPWQVLYDDTTPTCRLLNQPHNPADPLTQYYVIDGFIVSPNVEAVKVQTLQKDFVYSDHNPVLLEVELH